MRLYKRIANKKYSELSREQKMRSNARSYANVYQRRGKLIPEPCECCGAKEVEKHHDDYSKPLGVRWICRACRIKRRHSPDENPGYTDAA
jgi:hypothetical protein